MIALPCVISIAPLLPPTVVPIVPDLEEELEEDITRQVAEAPKVASRRVQTLSELNSQAALGMPSTTVRG